MEDADYKVMQRREKYAHALDDLTEHHLEYVEQMTSVFNKCQTNEQFKLQYFQAVLFSLHKTLDISQDPKYVISYKWHFSLSYN